MQVRVADVEGIFKAKRSRLLPIVKDEGYPTNLMQHVGYWHMNLLSILWSDQLFQHNKIKSSMCISCR